MRVGTFDDSGKKHIVSDVMNNKTKCNRHYISKEKVEEITKDEFETLRKQMKICGHCYNRFLGL